MALSTLFKTIVETPQEFNHVRPAGVVQRTEHFVENQQRERLPRPLRDHQRNRQPQHEVAQVLLTTGDHRFRQSVFEYQQPVGPHHVANVGEVALRGRDFEQSLLEKGLA